MLFNVVKAERHFHRVRGFRISTLERSAEYVCFRSAFRHRPSIHKHELPKVVSNIGFRVANKFSNMSTSGLLYRQGGFNSSTNQLSINSNEKTETPKPEFPFFDNSSSPSVHSTPDIEKKYVHCVYDAIAPHFSSTRFAKWPKVAGFLNSLRPGSVILDSGCGNGKYLGFNPESFYIGCDISHPLIQICASRGHEVVVADAVNLPYRTNFGDASISIAVLHHLSTERRRRKAIEELVRVVHKGGLVLITVWAVEQEDRSLLEKWTPLCKKYEEEWTGPSNPPTRNPSENLLESIPETDENGQSGDVEGVTISSNILEGGESSINGGIENHQEYFVPWHLPYHRAETSGALASALVNGLAKKDDKKGAVVYNRYYHVFVEGELERLVCGMDNAKIIEKFYDKSNWCLILQKI